MSSMPGSVLDRLRQPEHVGENRCLPCTVVNVAVAGIVAVGAALLWYPAGPGVFAAALAVIYLRGYLVPGTPTLTRRYFPTRVLAWFGKAPAMDEDDLPLASPPDGSVGERLLDAGIVVPCADDEDVCLDAGFRATWRRRIEQCRDDRTARERLAAILGVDPAALSLTADGEFAVTYDGAPIGQWPSRGAFLADLAAEQTLGEWLPAWDAFDDRERTELLVRLRAFLDVCPACDTDLDVNADRVSSCCGADLERVSIDCPECGTVFSGSHQD
jgi:hypothetical protein